MSSMSLQTVFQSQQLVLVFFRCLDLAGQSSGPRTDLLPGLFIQPIQEGGHHCRAQSRHLLRAAVRPQLTAINIRYNHINHSFIDLRCLILHHSYLCHLGLHHVVQQEVTSLVSILHDILLGLELVQHNVLVLLANVDLKFSNPEIERCQDLALADDVLADLGFRVISRAQQKIADFPSFEEVWISNFENIWAAYGVCGYVNTISSIFLQVDIGHQF